MSSDLFTAFPSIFKSSTELLSPAILLGFESLSIALVARIGDKRTWLGYQQTARNVQASSTKSQRDRSFAWAKRMPKSSDR